MDKEPIWKKSEGMTFEELKPGEAGAERAEERIPAKRIPDIPLPSPFPSSRPDASRAPIPEHSLKFPPLRKLSTGELEQLEHGCVIADQGSSVGSVDGLRPAPGIAFAGRGPARDFLSPRGGSITSESVNAVLISLGRAIGQVVGNLESPADAAIAAVDGLLKGIVAELEPDDSETVLALLAGLAKKRADRRRG